MTILGMSLLILRYLLLIGYRILILILLRIRLIFQKPSSQAAKELKLPLYEERRKAGISETRAKELESGMLCLANIVRDPKYIDSILSYGN